jgi:hypothetical protein
MTLGFILSKVPHILQMLWTVDTPAQPVGRGSANGFAHATVRPIYSRNGIRVSVSSRNVRDRE